MNNNIALLEIVKEECEKRGFKWTDLGKRARPSYMTKDQAGEIHQAISMRSPALLMPEQQSKLLGIPEPTIWGRIHVYNYLNT